MKSKISDKDIKYIFYSFVLNLLLGMMVVAVTFLLGDGIFYLGKDFNLQQIPFAHVARQSIENRNFLWLDNFDLGTGFINAFGFYSIGSPFFWLTFLIPNADYTIVVPCMLAVKFAVAGTGAYMYIKQYTENHNWALIASMFYAFSGHQIGNINYHFQDAFALFPFLMLALDKAVINHKKGLFALTVAIMAMTNYFFFVAVVVWLLLYFLTKLICGEYKLTKKLFITLAIESIVGVGISMWLFLPSVYAVFQNPRVSDNIFSYPLKSQLFLKPYQYADLLRAMIIPAENIFKRGIVLDFNTTAAEIYLPVIGMIPVFAFIMNNKKDWMSKLSIITFVIMLNPVLNSSFTAFNAEYYPRWFFMPILIFSTMAARHYDKHESIKPGLKIWALIVLLFCFSSMLWKYYFKAEFWPNKLQAFVMISMAVVGVSTVIFIDKFKNKKIIIPLFIIAIYIQTLGCFSVSSYYLQKYWNENNDNVSIFLKDVPEIVYPDENEYYRTTEKDTFMNIGIYSGKPSINTFATNISGSIFEFYHSNNIPRTVNSVINENEFGFYSFLGVKYLMVPESKNPNVRIRGFTQTPVWNSNGFDFYENTNYIGMGFSYDNAMSYEEHEKLTYEVRHLAAVDAIVLDKNQIQKYGHLYEFKKADEYIYFSHEDFDNVASEKRKSAPENFKVDNGIYTFDVTLPYSTIYYVSIPYDKGFSAQVNGIETEVLNINNGFIGLVLPEGESSVEISYYPCGLKMGIIISIISIIFFVAYAINKKAYLNQRY